jgi:sarcosine oxidase, subunit beta
MSGTYDVIIVGAGISGASLAYFLKKKGVEKVLVVERAAAAAPAGTGRSCAIVRTFYTLPLMARIAKEAVDLFAALPEELGRTGGFQQTGFNQLVPPDWVETTREITEMQRSVGIETVFIDPSEYETRYPWLNTDGVGAIVYEPKSGWADPVETTEAFIEGFKAAGGEVRYRLPCRRLLRDGDRVTGLELEDGPVSAGVVVNAAGPWAKYLAEFSGLDLPMTAMREQIGVWEVRPDRPMPTTPVSNAVDAVYMRPMGGRRWLLGRGFPKSYHEVDPNNFKESADNEYVMDVFDRMVVRIPPLQGAALIDSFAALYDVPPDWMPYVGPRSGLEGYYDFSGGSGHMFKTGPIIARELADWIVDGEVKEDFRQLSHDRVVDNNLFQQRFGGNRV